MPSVIIRWQQGGVSETDVYAVEFRDGALILLRDQGDISGTFPLQEIKWAEVVQLPYRAGRTGAARLG
jgi:hypothetical protein